MRDGFLLCNCAPCAANCERCLAAGECTTCRSGFMLSKDPATEWCLSCSYACSRCHDQTPSGCDACDWFYYLSPGGCQFAWWTLAAIVASLVALAWLFYRANRPLPPPLPMDEFVRQASGPAATTPYPSGAWRGYYVFGGRQHGVVEFELHFTDDGVVRGEGRDDVGGYRISGVHGGGRVAFRKQYVRGSTNAAGRVNDDNRGHAVEYRGKPARVVDGVPSLSGGVRGTWSIRHAIGNYDGAWHLWPVVMPTVDVGGGNSGGGGGGAAEVEEDSECCVCFDRRIDVCLRPCGHTALCGVCAARLHPRRCPLCRAPINEIQAVG